MEKDLKIIQVVDIFERIKYLVPIYQRNYAWDEKQIEQLIEDIESSITCDGEKYYLGNLIVNQRDHNIYEVIDGQQRLTTLYLLEKYLGIEFPNEALRFEAREKSNRTLDYIGTDDGERNATLPSEEILKGFRVIENYFGHNIINKNNFSKKLKNVFLIQIQVPKNIDLNHYFEIMNTRGEQLELHDIVKAKLLDVLKSDHDKNVAALIWEKCSDMDSYVQMNFEMEARGNIFSEDWSSLKPSMENFDSIKEQISKESELTGKKPLINILQENETNNSLTTLSNEENERFESIISFSNFLLQVNTAIQKLGEGDATLNDKNFLNNLSWSWSSSEKAKTFLYHILKCRVLFDKYVLKREFARDYKETGKWSLQRLKKYSNQNSSAKLEYVSTFGDENSTNKKLRTLQSCLRITYTSPKTMYWISEVLSNLLENEATDLVSLLEDYCKRKVDESDYTNKSGFEFERIVFSYLDYLIYRDGYSYKGEAIVPALQDSWQFQFRSSIEHFQPQHPTEGECWEKIDLNGFGNLALITISGNSRFSNLPPIGKINSYPSLIDQSLKLRIMKEMVVLDDGKWTEGTAEQHKNEMFEI